MRKKCVLFGAGADIPYGISGGKDFALKVLGYNAYSMNNAISLYYKSLLINVKHKNWYSPFKQKSWKVEDIVEAAVRKKLLSLEDKIS